jgi:hypothetical protein
MEDWGGYPNAATARYKERERLRKENEAKLRQRKGELAARARRLNQSGAEAAATSFNVVPDLDDGRRS